VASWRSSPAHALAGATLAELVRVAGARWAIFGWIQPLHPDDHYHRWSRWRRRHQARARKSHYQRRRHAHLMLL
jgi:hypothetical protein